MVAETYPAFGYCGSLLEGCKWKVGEEGWPKNGKCRGPKKWDFGGFTCLLLFRLASSTSSETPPDLANHTWTEWREQWNFVCESASPVRRIILTLRFFVCIAPLRTGGRPSFKTGPHFQSLNSRQRDADQDALRRQVSLVSGPPGSASECCSFARMSVAALLQMLHSPPFSRHWEDTLHRDAHAGCFGPKSSRLEHLGKSKESCQKSQFLSILVCWWFWIHGCFMLSRSSLRSYHVRPGRPEPHESPSHMQGLCCCYPRPTLPQTICSQHCKRSRTLCCDMLQRGHQVTSFKAGWHSGDVPPSCIGFDFFERDQKATCLATACLLACRRFRCCRWAPPSEQLLGHGSWRQRPLRNGGLNGKIILRYIEINNRLDTKDFNRSHVTVLRSKHAQDRMTPRLDHRGQDAVHNMIASSAHRFLLQVSTVFFAAKSLRSTR